MWITVGLQLRHVFLLLFLTVFTLLSKLQEGTQSRDLKVAQEVV